MDGLAKTIEDCRNLRLKVYGTDPDQVHRDVNVVSETLKDHIGRWPFELIQNCDDAEAAAVLIKVTKDAVYVADRGHGLGPEAIKSLSGTHLSEKPIGAIGRKGLGFKAVYEITCTPAVFTGDDDGVFFCPVRARDELIKLDGELNGALRISADSRVPHEWLPFWVSRREAAQTDATLSELQDWRTVVKLPLKSGADFVKATAGLRELPSHFLLTL